MEAERRRQEEAAAEAQRQAEEAERRRRAAEAQRIAKLNAEARRKAEAEEREMVSAAVMIHYTQIIRETVGTANAGEVTRAEAPATLHHGRHRRWTCYSSPAQKLASM